MAGASSLLLDEHFASGDGRFVDELLASTNAKRLKALAQRWYEDTRPFAREALHRYIDDGCDRPHHRPLVKALFKMAERAGDDDTMGRFLVAFDRLLARRFVTRATCTRIVRAGGSGRYGAYDPSIRACGTRQGV